MGYVEELDKRKELLNTIRKQAVKDIKKAPEGQLHCKIIDNKTRFYYRRSPSDTNITAFGKSESGRCCRPAQAAAADADNALHQN